MDLMVLNTNLDAISVVDIYKSFIWTDRYFQCGDFELYSPMTSDILTYFKQDYYLQRRGSDRAMIIEKILIETDAEEGNTITITGRSLESILDRRIIWGQMTVSGNLQDAIETLLNACIISPSNVNRKIENFVFKKSTDPAITSLIIEAQYTGDNLYDVVQQICEERGIGFKVTINASKQFVFELYSGVDRSYDQTNLPYVVFSPSFDNVISSNYVESRSSLKNVALVGGEGEGSARKYTAVGNPVGLNRREMFVDARDISSDVGDEETLTPEEYTALLRQRGSEKLAEYKDVTSFEGQMETSIMYKYGEDFFEGDIVQMMNEYGHSAKVRVLEVIISENEEGTSTYPTFQTIEEEEEEPEEPSLLPDGYTQLEYIQSNGTQYIDTGYKPNQNTRVELDANLLAETEYPMAVFGCRDDDLTTVNAFILWEFTSQQFRSDYGTTQQYIDLSTSSRYLIDMNRNVTTIDVASTTHNIQTFQATSNLTIFAENDPGGVDPRMASMRLYACKVYDNDILVRDYIPAKDPDGVVGLYDLIDNAFYLNAGTGTFVAGEKGEETT